MAKQGSGCLILFSLPFAAVGVGMGVWLAMTVVGYLQMQHWVETPATILQAKLETSRNNKSNIYEATARYEYRYEGRRYTNNRVSLPSPSGDVSLQQDLHRQLSECQRTGKPLPCYVNPKRPKEAILFRGLRWEMIGFQALFVLVFGGAGFGLLTVSIMGVRQGRAEAKLKQADPDRPWLLKAEWASGRIASSSKTLVWVSILAALFWNLLTSPLWFILPGEVIQKGNRLALFGLVFPLVGLGLAAWAVYTLLQWRKFGQSVFQMASVPGVLGGELAGVIRTAAHIQPEEGFQVTLNCIQRRTTGSGDKRSTQEEILWQDEQIIVRQLGQSDADPSAIPVLFAIPYNCRPTDETHSNNQTIWRLKVAARVPGIDYAAAFDVPVFQTPQSDPNFTPDAAALAQYAAPADPDRELREAGVIKTVSPSGEGSLFIFPAGRNLANAVCFSLFCLLWSGAIVLMFRLGAPMLFLIVFGLIDALLVLMLVDLWFYRSEVDVSPRGLTITGGLFGLGAPRRIELADVTRIDAVNRMQAGQTVYYHIVVTCRDGKKVTAGKRVAGHRLTDAVIGQIEQAMGGERSRLESDAPPC